MRAWILLAVLIVASFNVYLGSLDRGALVWVDAAPNGWNNVCTYYTPVRLFQLRIPVGEQCTLSHDIG